MREELRSSAKRLQDTLKGLGFKNKVIELKETTRSAKDAARAVGCRVEQIAKSIVFRSGESDRSVLVVASGPNRINEKKISEMISEPLLKADADFVKEKTGYAIGGVPPLGHLEVPITFIDEDLLRYDEIWAAAGTPNAVFNLAPADLQKMTDGRVISVK